MNPLKFGPDQIKNGRLIVICSNWQNILKLWSSGWISQTAMNMFDAILYTCIFYNFPMNPVKFGHDQIQNGWLIAIVVCSNWQNIWKPCPSWWLSKTPMNILCKNLPKHILHSFHECCGVSSWSNSKWSTYCHCDKNIAQIGKIFKNCVRPDEYLKNQWIFFGDTLIYNILHILQSSHESFEVWSWSN